jgi:hypothetical protein
VNQGLHSLNLPAEEVRTEKDKRKEMDHSLKGFFKIFLLIFSSKTEIIKRKKVKRRKGVGNFDLSETEIVTAFRKEG